ncbi:hypothetical protein QTI33_09145 [Variovorax sp. J22P271]|uniref:hypothetical protein n=1 Tax=Variovorax davisae TaxID=3053515 RepID=UPI002579044B|nr:hypothetical protein [Variovorax sp. J22P271]MDM0032293.1 hypothetical protein [Variovorax sp. J22P271]
METARSFVDQQIVAARKQPAAGKLREELVEAAGKVHQPILVKRKAYRPPVISAEIEDVGLINASNAIVTFDVRSGYPPGSNITNDSKVSYVYALYKRDGAWKVVAEYQLFRFGGVS